MTVRHNLRLSGIVKDAAIMLVLTGISRLNVDVVNACPGTADFRSTA